jgi:hypothetical protein
VLTFNFSLVDPDPEKLESSFISHVQDRVMDFIQKYGAYLKDSPDKDYFSKKIEESRSASDIFSTLLTLCKSASHKLYVIIDEYDNFANTILSTIGENVYRDLTHGAGYFRSFFNVLKGGATGTGAPITRSFIMGVSPITMDDVTSGYNIGENVSLDSAFNRVLGFTGDEIGKMLNYYKSAGLIAEKIADITAIIDNWYGNYLFSEYSPDRERMVNSDMVLYFLKEYFKNRAIPKDLIDRNVRIDYKKLKHIIIVDRYKTKGKTTNGNFNRLKEIIEKGETSAKLQKGFPFEKLLDEDNFISLLFYFGLLTIKSPELDALELIIPNETIRRLYYDYIKEGYEETDVYSLNLSTYGRLMKDMAKKGEWKPLFEYITGRMKESMSLRDLITGEKSIQAFLNVYLGLSNLYIIHGEKEMNKGYADLVMEPFLARYEEIKYSYILEIKYIKAGVKPGNAEARQLQAEAEVQLKHYAIDKKFRKNIEKTTLIKIVLIFSGHEAIYIVSHHLSPPV